MGIYLNPGAAAFAESRRSKIYVDKSGMIAYLNSVLGTEQKYVCVSRPRRFGKSMAAKMIAAYYDRTVEQSVLFQGLAVEEKAGFGEFAGKYDVLRLNMQDFLSYAGHDVDKLIGKLVSELREELLEEYDEDGCLERIDPLDINKLLGKIHDRTGVPFVVVIDEWDCIFREFREDKVQQEKYLDFLRRWLKDKTYIGLAYMTGILPIKKYGTHSALNMFTEFSMTGAEELASYAGFTEEEVRGLCEAYHMDFMEAKSWYDGYRLRETVQMSLSEGIRSRTIEIYSPRSVVNSMLSGQYMDYWNQTETFEALRAYIDMNFDGLKDVVLELMAGARHEIDVRGFSNDMVSFESYQDVLTLLIHLGYLGYDSDTREVFIPNKELMDEYVTATTRSDWLEVINSVKKSKALLLATWAGEAEKVAEGLKTAHFETSHIQYNDENALSYVLSLAYYAARQYYNVVRELPTGDGFADLVFVPRPKYADKPAMVVELKYGQSADTAIQQIKKKHYTQALSGYEGELLLVGVSYDKRTREHECVIEQFQMADCGWLV